MRAARSAAAGGVPARGFLAPEGTGVAALARLLAPLGRLAAAPAYRHRATLLDTFDRRAHRAGLLVEEVRAGARVRTAARPLGGGRAVAAARGPAPRFARDLPPGRLRGRLLPILEPRALLPLASLEVEIVPLELRARGGRVVARLQLERGRAGAPGEQPRRALPPALVARAGRLPAAVASRLAARPGFAAAPADALAAALAPLGRAPRDTEGAPAPALDPAMPAREAARAVLLGLLGAIERNLPGARGDVDPEFLHDLRVAVRRSRSVLGQLKGVFPPATAARFGAELRWLQEASGAARDLDVLLLELPALGALLPSRSRRSLGPLARLVAARREEAHRELAAALASPRLARFLARWRAFLERPAPRRTRGAPRAGRPARGVVAARIRRLFRRALAEGRAITDRSPAADLHELRKTCKKLRYLLELFPGLLDRAGTREAVEALKGLQDDLGRHQDLQVQAGALLGYARALAAQGRARPPAYLAIGMLAERLRGLQSGARREFAERFRPFAGRENRRGMRRLLAPG